jgi:protein SCO1/2
MCKFLFIPFFVSCLLFAACQKPEAEPESADTVRYDFRGKIISVDRPSKMAQIAHEDIPGLMPKMTMEFRIKDEWVWEDLLPGAEIRATLVYDKNAKDPMLLEKIAISAAPNPDLPQPEVKAPEQIGKAVPAISLIDQDGERTSLKDFGGKTLAVTFIYRECPLPEFCIKMSRNFSDAALKIQNSEEYRDKFRLLSISFDPTRDTPAKLREYGTGYLGNPAKPDFTIWQLAVGSEKDIREIADFFGLKYELDENDKTQFNHSLVTAIIGPDGKVAKMLPGNRWSPEQLLVEMESITRK